MIDDCVNAANQISIMAGMSSAVAGSSTRELVVDPILDCVWACLNAFCVVSGQVFGTEWKPGVSTDISLNRRGVTVSIEMWRGLHKSYIIKYLRIYTSLP